MKKIKKFLVITLCAMLATAPALTETALAATTSVSQKSAAAAGKTQSVRKGWYTQKNGKKKYYRRGKYVTGFQKIGKYYYLFSRNGNMITRDTRNKNKNILYYINEKGQVEGLKKGSNYYSPNGRRLSGAKLDEFQAYQNARKIMARITTSRMSKKKKLEVCFRWVMSKPYHTWRRFDEGGEAWYAVHANDHFVRGSGDCMADASAFAYFAKALGYKNVYVCTNGYRNNNRAHGWTEINGRVYDPYLAETSGFLGYYGIKYSRYWMSRVMHVKIA